MIRQNFDATLPATRTTTEVKERVRTAAKTAGVDQADIIRQCIETTLPLIEIQLGLVKVEEPEPAEPVKEDRAAGCFGGPPLPR